MAITIAKVIGAFGIKGELKLYLHTDFATLRFKKGKKVLFRREGESETMSMTVSSFREDGVVGILCVDEIIDRNVAETWINTWVEIADDQRKSLPKDTYYLSQLIGCEVRDETDTLQGQVVEVITLTAQPLLRIRRPSRKDVLLPFVSAWVREVDSQARVIHVMKGEGMFDED